MGHIFQPGMPNPPQLPPPQIAVAAPINDIQLISVVAGSILSMMDSSPTDEDVRTAVETACSIVGAAVVIYKTHRLDYYAEIHSRAQDQLRADRGINAVQQ